MCRQFLAMLSAGLPVLEILSKLGQQVENVSLKLSLLKAEKALSNGATLHEAFATQGNTFPPLFINMIKAGEAGGFLERTMKNLATHFENQHSMEEKIRSALAYPLLVITVAIAVIMVMILYVLPQFESIFNSMGIEMPYLNRILISCGNILKTKWYFIFPLLVTLAFIIKSFISSNHGRKAIDYLSLNLPLIGNIYKISIAARFSRMFGVLLASGINISMSLSLVAMIINNNIVKSSLLDLEKAVNRGESIAARMSKHTHFPLLLSQMMCTGEETGTLPSTMEVSANYYESELSYILGRFSTILEPALLLIVGIFIGILVFSILSPMYEIFQMI